MPSPVVNWFARNAHWVMLALFLVLAPVTVGFLGVSVLALLAGALGGASIGALLADVAMVAAVTTVLVAAEVALAVGFVVAVARRVSFPTSEPLARVFSVLETLLPPLRDLDLSDRFEPTLEERQREVKARYVDGELTEREFEREMQDLLDDTELPGAPMSDPEQFDVVEPRSEGSDRTGDSPAVDPSTAEERRETDRE